MPLALTCSCGTSFDVEDTLAGQTVACPDCQTPIAVPVPRRQPLRTSNYAVASVVLALVLAFTGIGTLLAVLLGVIALIQISLHRDRVTGIGYALFGIVCGTVFTGLFALAMLRTELFGMGLVREGLLGNQIERGGSLDVSQPEDGFAIRRPSSSWGVAKDDFAQKLDSNADLMLVNLAKDAYVDVTLDWLGNRTLEAYREDVLDNYREHRQRGNAPRQPLAPRGLEIRQKRTLPANAEREALEVLFDVRLGAQKMTFLLRVVRPTGTNRVFLLRGWCFQRRFSLVEAEIQQALDSFRILDKDP